MSTRQATRERLLEAAEKVFAQKGYYEAAVDEIVTQSSTSKGSLYFHFPDKESLFRAVIDHLGERLIRKVERDIIPVSDPIDRLDIALATTLETLTGHKTLAKLLLSKGAGMGSAFVRNRTQISARFASLIKELLDQAGVQQRTPELDTEVVAYAWLGAISEVVIKWLETGTPHPTKEALPTLRALLLNGAGITPRTFPSKSGALTHL